jgi:hypothetical protein
LRGTLAGWPRADRPSKEKTGPQQVGTRPRRSSPRRGARGWPLKAVQGGNSKRLGPTTNRWSLTSRSAGTHRVILSIPAICGGPSGVTHFDDLVREFVSRRKFALHRPRWRTGAHPDYAAASMAVQVPGTRLRGTVVLAAHVLRSPVKYCFSLVFRAERVLALDVNPGRLHRNLLTPGSIGGTHWQRWPTMDAEPDNRDQPFTWWLHEFLTQANVICRFRVQSPPRGVQLELPDGKAD